MATKCTFADEIYLIFKFNRTTSISWKQLRIKYEQHYIRLAQEQVKVLPFIKIKYGIIHLAIEEEDICRQQICRRNDCQLIHSYEQQHILLIPQPTLKQRLQFILQTLMAANHDQKQITFSELVRKHNEKYPQFLSHEPTVSGITNRVHIRSIFVLFYDTFSQDFLISFSKKAIKILSFQSKKKMPQQTDKYYLLINISTQLTAKEFIPALKYFIETNTKKNIVDIYAKSNERLAWFSSQNKSIVMKFIKKINKQTMKCFGRTVTAKIVNNPDGGYKVAMRNLNAIINKNAFESWLYSKTNTQKRKDNIYNIQIVYPKEKIISQCIIVFETNNDLQFVIKEMRNLPFKGLKLKMKQWTHPYSTHAQTEPIKKKLIAKPQNKKTQKQKQKKKQILKPKENLHLAPKQKEKEKEKQHLVPKQKQEEKLFVQDDDTESESEEESSSSCILPDVEPDENTSSSLDSSSCILSEENHDIDQLQYNDNENDKSKLNTIKKEEWLRILNTMTADTFSGVLHETTDIICHHCDTLKQLRDIVYHILEFAIKNKVMMHKYVDLCKHLDAYSHQLTNKYIVMNSGIFIQTIMRETCLLFIKYKENKHVDANSFFNVMILSASLYNQQLFKINMIFNDILNTLLPPQNKQLSEIDIEAICILMMKCGKLLDKDDKPTMDKYIKLLTEHSNYQRFGDNVIGLIDTVKEMRNNKWMKYLQMQHKFNKLETEYKQLKDGSNELRIEHNKVTSEHNELCIKYDNLNETHKELRIKYDNLKEKRNELRIKYDNLNEKHSKILQDYTLWNSKDITNWIINLDISKYEKYADKLIINLVNECIDGKCLINIQKNDLHRLGITQFRDKQHIYDEIQKLIETTQRNNALIKQCVMCEKRIPIYAYTPCGHLCICRTCKKTINFETCPVCQTQCDNLIQIYS